MPEGYSGTPLRQKLGLTESAAACLVGVPETILAELEPLPPRYDTSPMDGPYTFVLIVTAHRCDFESAFAAARSRLAVRGAIWVGWPKRAAKVATDLDFNAVRSFGPATGLVDVKVCAMDATWSGLKFVRRRATS